jgi:hypothetical protein
MVGLAPKKRWDVAGENSTTNEKEISCYLQNEKLIAFGPTMA